MGIPTMQLAPQPPFDLLKLKQMRPEGIDTALGNTAPGSPDPGCDGDHTTDFYNSLFSDK